MWLLTCYCILTSQGRYVETVWTAKPKGSNWLLSRWAVYCLLATVWTAGVAQPRCHKASITRATVSCVHLPAETPDTADLAPGNRRRQWPGIKSAVVQCPRVCWEDVKNPPAEDARAHTEKKSVHAIFTEPYLRGTDPNKHKTMKQLWLNVGPSSETVA